VQRPGQLHRSTPAELKARRDAERVGVPFVVYRDAGDAQRLLVLDGEREEVTIGRQPASDIALTWDEEVSRAHADLERRGEVWTIVDDGRSRNGSFVNGERLLGRRVLHHGDVIAIGRTQIEFCAPLPELDGSTVAASRPAHPTLSPAQRRVLVALCRPYKGSPAFATPATNQDIADELVLSVDAIKTHMRLLFQKFGVEHLPQTQKRARLVERALLSGIVSERDL
jgi:pSer/pThr/pTyr-binding forkhead associated (FHA) protein